MLTAKPVLWTTGDSSASLPLGSYHPALTLTSLASWRPASWFAMGVSTDLRKVSIDLHTKAFCTLMHTACPQHSPFSKVKSVMGTLKTCLAWSSYDCFHPFLSKTDENFNRNQSDRKHFAGQKERVQTSHFILMKKPIKEKFQGVNITVSSPPSMESNSAVEYRVSLITLPLTRV